MRIPVRSETDAFWLVADSALAVGVAVLVGYLAAPALGVAVLGVIVFPALIWDAAVGEPESRLREAQAVGHRDGVHGQRLVVVVASAIPAEDQLVGKLMRPGSPCKLVIDREPVSNAG